MSASSSASVARQTVPSLSWRSASNPAQRRARERLLLGLWLAVHVLLALAMQAMPLLATLHAVGTLAIGLVLAAKPWGREEVGAYAVAYLAGAELLWRINSSAVFWEYGKYASLAIALVMIGRMRLRRPLALPMAFYLLPLLPACGLTVGALGLTEAARQAISSSMSGPVALAILVLLFSGLDSRKIRIDRLLWAGLAPIVGVYSLTVLSTLTSAVQFSSQSNFATSAGYGPNQTSSILGLGFLFAILLALHSRDSFVRLGLLVLATALLAQTVLTFSRGGVFNVVVSTSLFAAHYIQRRSMQKVLLIGLILLMVAGSIVLPRLDRWSEGFLSERYSSFDTTGRARIADADIQVFKDNWLLGVGAGMSSTARKRYIDRRVAAHTEYTRLLSEHGLFGILGLLAMAVIGFFAYRRAPHVLAKAWVAGLAGWTLASMSHVSMRVVAISFVFGLATLNWGTRPPLRPVRVHRQSQTLPSSGTSQQTR